MAQQASKPSTPVKTAAPAKAADSRPVEFIFDKGNYRMLLISIAVVAFGFFLMAGTTDIYSTTKIVIAPVVVLAGFGIGFFAIFKKPEAKA